MRNGQGGDSACDARRGYRTVWPQISHCLAADCALFHKLQSARFHSCARCAAWPPEVRQSYPRTTAPELPPPNTGNGQLIGGTVVQMWPVRQRASACIFRAPASSGPRDPAVARLALKGHLGFCSTAGAFSSGRPSIYRGASTSAPVHLGAALVRPNPAPSAPAGAIRQSA